MVPRPVAGGKHRGVDVQSPGAGADLPEITLVANHRGVGLNVRVGRLAGQAA